MSDGRDTDAPAVSVQGLTKTFDDKTAVDELSFRVNAGEILGLVGPNGAGKTTTIRCIAGILPATRGTCSILDHDIADDPLAAKQLLALVADDPNLFASLTVWEHLQFIAQVYGLSSWQDRAGELLEEFEITDRRDSLADELSRGMKQKVAVCGALLHEPSVLMLDEPLTGLDPHAIRTLHGTLRRCADAGTAVIISSHLLGQIANLCSHFLILKEGQKLQSGSLAEIREQLDKLPEDASLEDIFFQATRESEE